MARQKGKEVCSVLRGWVRYRMRMAQQGLGKILPQGRRPKLEADVERLSLCLILIQYEQLQKVFLSEQEA